MKKIVLLSFGAILIAAAVILTTQRPPQPQQERQPESDTRTYRNETRGVSFSYPKNYFVIERELGNGERSHYNVMLAEDTQENRDVFDGKLPGREGPPVIAIDIFQNFEGLGAEAWVRNNSFSNFKLSDGTLAKATVGGRDAVRYSFDGLYRADAIVINAGNRIIMISGSYLESADPIRNDYESVVRSFAIFTPATALRERDAESPAAGICELSDASRVSVVIAEDIPQPRCVRMHPNQELSITNSTSAVIRAGFSGTEYSSLEIAPGSSRVIPLSVGALLAPGVHRLSAHPFSGPEVWVLDQ